eukprot:5287449-Ditylum_brightwellii.AAC.1
MKAIIDEMYTPLNLKTKVAPTSPTGLFTRDLDAPKFDGRATKDQGIIVGPNRKESFSLCVDADFSGNWFKQMAMDDASATKSRTGYIITYDDCPILWVSKLQIVVTLSTTEAENVALIMAAREAIVLII